MKNRWYGIALTLLFSAAFVGIKIYWKISWLDAATVVILDLFLLAICLAAGWEYSVALAFLATGLTMVCPAAIVNNSPRRYGIILAVLGHGVGITLILRQVRVNAYAEKDREFLRKMRIQMRSMLTALNVGVVVSNGRGKIIEANDCFRAMIGYPDLDPVETPLFWDDLIESPGRTDFSLSSKQAQEVAFFHRDGRKVKAACMHVPVEGASGLRISVVLDRSLEQTLREAVTKASADKEAAEKRTISFLAILGHEFRNALQPIILNLRVIEEMARKCKIPDVADRGKAVFQQASIMSRLVDDLVDASFVRSDKMILRKEPALIQEIVAECAESVKHHIEDRRQKLSLAFPESDATWCEVDTTRIRQVILNLLLNASKYTQNGGTIWATVENGHEEIIVRVQDNGIGITSQFLPTAWDMFTQEAATGTDAVGGLGVGLAIVKRIVELHGGKVEAYSEGRNQGSTFTVRLPCKKFRWVHKKNSDSKPPTNRELKVLIVDDNPAVADATSACLALDGIKVKIARSGEEALEIVKDMRPTVVFLDIGLPGISGFEVAGLMREIAPEAYLVAMTGYGGDVREKLRQDDRFRSILVKPVTPEQLKEVLGKIPNSPA